MASTKDWHNELSHRNWDVTDTLHLIWLYSQAVIIQTRQIIYYLRARDRHKHTHDQKYAAPV